MALIVTSSNTDELALGTAHVRTRQIFATAARRAHLGGQPKCRPLGIRAASGFVGMASRHRVHRTCAVPRNHDQSLPLRNASSRRFRPGGTTLVTIFGSCLFLIGCPLAMHDDFFVAPSDAGGVAPNPNDRDAAEGSPEWDSQGAVDGGDATTGGSIAPEGGGGCIPTSCQALGFDCGSVADGCGHAINCGSCAAPATCGGGGEANICACKRKTCAEINAECGTADDGCMSQLDCGTCPAPETCGGAGVVNQCGCKPTTCAMQGAMCGAIADGCGGTLNCGTCPSLQVCGSTSPNKCGLGVCIPLTCAKLGFNCGSAADGCGGVLQCGTCAAGQRCGAAGLNRCGCIPSTCDKLGADCGPVGDGCGGTLNCGTCKGNKVCGAKRPNHCDKPGK
jgi:hypothetical protein